MQDKIRQQKHGIDKWNIFPLKNVFSWTQMKAILSAELYTNLQRALSPKEFLFTWNKELFEHNNPQHNREIYDLFQSYIVINPNKLPENFTKLFELKSQDASIREDVEAIFKKARLLDKKSARIVFVDDKIVIFRNEQTLTHKESTGRTQGEKKRTEISTTFNTFSNIYDAIRSQYHTITSSQEKQDDYKLLQKDILTLAQEIQTLGFEVKDWAFKRSLDTIIAALEGATNYRVLGANLQNLHNLTFTNTVIDANLLEWAKNKLSKRFNDLQNIVGVVSRQLNDLENILTEHETLLKMFLAQRNFADRPIFREDYDNAYSRLEKKYWPIAPFSIFHQWIKTYKDDKIIFPKIFPRIKTFFEVYQDEHQKKLAWFTFDTELFKEFAQIKNNLPGIEKMIIG